MKSNLKNRFLEFSIRKNLFAPGDKVLVTVSGGIDSMVLLHLLLKCRRRLGIDLAVVHFNHQIRGKAALEDQCLVENLCKEKALPYFLIQMNVKKYAKETGQSVEETGHLLRKEKFEEIAKNEGFNKIATGHHLDDQAETIIMRLIQGTGLRGLAGIRLKSESWVRPLLFASRNEIEIYAKENAIPFREDQTNKDEKIFRNKIRYRLLPMLRREYNPEIVNHLANFSSLMEEWDTFLTLETEKALKEFVNRISQNKFEVELSLFKIYFSWVIISVFEHIFVLISGGPIKISFNQYSDFRNWLNYASLGSKFVFKKDFICYKKRDKIVLLKEEKKTFSKKIEIQPENEYTIPANDMKVCLSFVNASKVQFTKNSNEEFIDGTNFQFPLFIRQWKASDRFVPLGSGHKKLISDYLTDKKIGRPERDEILVLLNKEEIVAILGLQISQLYRIHEKSKLIYRLTVNMEN